MDDFVLFESLLLVLDEFSEKSHLGSRHRWQEDSDYMALFMDRIPLTLMDEVPVEIFLASEAPMEIFGLDSFDLLPEV